jgi:hypothetical protein
MNAFTIPYASSIDAVESVDDAVALLQTCTPWTVAVFEHLWVHQGRGPERSWSATVFVDELSCVATGQKPSIAEALIDVIHRASGADLFEDARRLLESAGFTITRPEPAGPATPEAGPVASLTNPN